jgi:hypothetical protein
MVFTLAFLANFGRLLLADTPLLAGLGAIIVGLAISVGKREG